MAQFKYGLSYDFHISTDIPDVGAAFDAEAFPDQVKACGADFITWHTRCNQVNANNTRYGKRYSSLQFDTLHAIGEACHRKGIRFSVYFNGCLNDEEVITMESHLECECLPVFAHCLRAALEQVKVRLHPE